MQSNSRNEYSTKTLKICSIILKILAVPLFFMSLMICFAFPVVGIIGCLFALMLFFAAGKTAKEAQQTINSESAYTAQLNSPLNNYVIIDFETTGLNPKTDRIIEVGAIKVRNGEIVDTYETYVNPLKHITKRVTDINGISDDTVVDAPLENDVLPEIGNFISGEIIVGYNINFDLNFLKAALDRYNVDFVPGITVDVLRLARKHITGVENYKLETVMKVLEPDFVQAHRALRDCCATKKVLDYIKQNKSINELIQ